MSQALRLRAADGYELAGEMFSAAQPRGCVVLAGALGVPRGYYAAFAQGLANQGISVLTFDWRGSGDSRQGAVRGRHMRMVDWGRLDLEAALASALEQVHPEVFLVGHSAGGQLLGLAPSAARLRGAVLVAASAPNLRHYPASSWPKLLLAWYGFAPLLGHLDDYPAKRLGLGSTQVAGGVVREWARWARSPDYLFSQRFGLPLLGYRSFTQPLLACGFDDDDYAPPQAVDALLQQFPRARLRREILQAGEHGPLGHFGVFRSQHQALWARMAAWMREHIPNPQSSTAPGLLRSEA